MSNKVVNLGIVTDAVGAHPRTFPSREKKLIETAVKNKNVELEFKNIPVVSAASSVGAAYTGGSGQIVALNLDGELAEMHCKAAQTIIAPVLTANGLDIGMDQTENDGIEIALGNNARSKYAYTVGQEKVLFKAKVKIQDVSGTDNLVLGFRSPKAYQAAFASYDEYAGFNINEGNVTAVYDDGTTAGSVASLGTVADLGVADVQLILHRSGLVDFYVNGAKVLASVTLPADTVVIPFIFFLHDADVAGTVELQELVWGKY